jgi:hypothetical protein
VACRAFSHKTLFLACLSRVLAAGWNGSRWARVPSPNLGTTAQLFAVAATSASNAWAVGIFSDGTEDHPLAVHCC